jgi:Fur family transcriptional regulator, ferric uptake regulator
MISATQSNHPLGNVATGSFANSVLDAALIRIQQANMRVTKPRIAIIAALEKSASPLTIERIYQDIGEASCDLVTVYRCLSAFEAIGLVRRSYLHAGTCLYELTIDRPRHYHIVCKACNQSERVDYLSIDGMEQVLAERGYTQLSHVIEFFGVCPACQQKAPARNTAPAIPHVSL